MNKKSFLKQFLNPPCICNNREVIEITHTVQNQYNLTLPEGKGLYFRHVQFWLLQLVPKTFSQQMLDSLHLQVPKLKYPLRN